MRVRVQRFGCPQWQWASLCSCTQSLALEPEFVEHNLEPLLEESSSTLCCRLATFGQGSTAALKAGQHRISNRCAPA